MIRLLRKLFLPPAPDPEEAAVAAALQDLARLEVERPALSRHVAFLRDVLPKLFVEPAGAELPDVDGARWRQKLSQGIPCLRGEKFLIDTKLFRRLWLEVAQMRETHQGDWSADALAEAARCRRLPCQALVDAALAGDRVLIHGYAEELGLDPGLMETILRLTLFPTLVHANMGLERIWRRVPWERGYCPLCGSRPLLGEFRGLEQTRFLRCGLCAAEWQFHRLRCPFCDNRDHESLGYLQVEGEENRYRAATCDACRGYVKMVATLSPLSPPQLLVTDLATLHLDLAAAERGYGIGKPL